MPLNRSEMSEALTTVMEAAERFEANETRLNTFINRHGAYVTNTDPPEKVQTLPSYMEELRGRYLTLVLRDGWRSGTSYAMNDVVKHDAAYYICTAPHVSSDDFTTDLAARLWLVYSVGEVNPAGETAFGAGYEATQAEVENGLTDPGREGYPAFVTPEKLRGALPGPATATTAGTVRPDGTSILVSAAGLLNVNAHYGGFPGELLHAYLTAGVSNFTVPDPKGDGLPYWAEVWAKGAGGGAGRSASPHPTYTGYSLAGGWGGEGEFVRKRVRLTPGELYAVTVPAGGAASTTAVATAGASASFGSLVTASGAAASGIGGGTFNITADTIRIAGQHGTTGGWAAVYGYTPFLNVAGGMGGGQAGSAASVQPENNGIMGGGGAPRVQYSGGSSIVGGAGGDGFVAIWRVLA